MDIPSRSTKEKKNRDYHFVSITAFKTTADRYYNYVKLLVKLL